MKIIITTHTVKISLLLLFFFFISIITAYFVNDASSGNLLRFIATIIGIMLGGIFASLAIVFGLLKSEELHIIYKRSLEEKREDIFGNYLSNIKIDIVIVIFTFCFTNILVIISEMNLVFLEISMWILLGLGIFGLILSILAEYDTIMSLFYLNQLRYELAKNRDKEIN